MFSFPMGEVVRKEKQNKKNEGGEKRTNKENLKIAKLFSETKTCYSFRVTFLRERLKKARITVTKTTMMVHQTMKD